MLRNATKRPSHSEGVLRVFAVRSEASGHKRSADDAFKNARWAGALAQEIESKRIKRCSVHRARVDSAHGNLVDAAVASYASGKGSDLMRLSVWIATKYSTAQPTSTCLPDRR